MREPDADFTPIERELLAHAWEAYTSSRRRAWERARAVARRSLAAAVYYESKPEDEKGYTDRLSIPLVHFGYIRPGVDF